MSELRKVEIHSSVKVVFHADIPFGMGEPDFHALHVTDPILDKSVIVYLSDAERIDLARAIAPDEMATDYELERRDSAS